MIVRKNIFGKVGNFFEHQGRCKICSWIEWEHSQLLKITLKYSDFAPKGKTPVLVPLSRANCTRSDPISLVLGRLKNNAMCLINPERITGTKPCCAGAWTTSAAITTWTPGFPVNRSFSRPGRSATWSLGRSKRRPARGRNSVPRAAPQTRGSSRTTVRSANTG